MADAPGSDAAFAKERAADESNKAAAQHALGGPDTQMQQLKGDFGKIKQMAADGGFAVDPDSGKAIQKVIKDYQNSWISTAGDLRVIADNGLPLGRPHEHYDHYASHVSGYHMFKAADGIKKFQDFNDALNEFHEAIEQAVKNFSKMDDDNVQSFKTDDYL